jgi:hypothetical protein
MKAAVGILRYAVTRDREFRRLMQRGSGRVAQSAFPGPEEQM